MPGRDEQRRLIRGIRYQAGAFEQRDQGPAAWEYAPPMRRRDFLSSLVVLPALGRVERVEPAQDTAERRGLKLGTVTYNIAKDWDVPTLIANLTEARFDAVELRTTHRHGVEIALSPAARADIRSPVRRLAHQDWRTRHDVRVPRTRRRCRPQECR